MHASVIPNYLTSDTIFKGFISYLCDFVFHSVDNTFMSNFLQMYYIKILKLEISTFTVISVIIWRHFPYHYQTPDHVFVLKLHGK